MSFHYLNNLSCHIDHKLMCKNLPLRVCVNLLFTHEIFNGYRDIDEYCPDLLVDHPGVVDLTDEPTSDSK